MTITLGKQKTINKNFKKKIQKMFPKFYFFSGKKKLDLFLQNHEMRLKMESQNSGDHELWNHEMRRSPVHRPGIRLDSSTLLNSKYSIYTACNFLYFYQWKIDKVILNIYFLCWLSMSKNSINRVVLVFSII